MLKEEMKELIDGVLMLIMEKVRVNYQKTNFSKGRAKSLPFSLLGQTVI